MKLRIGLIGLGEGWQTRHRPALRSLQDRFDVRAVYAPVPLLAEQAAKEFGACQVDGYRALVRRSDVDAVMVLENSWHGLLPMLAASDSGKAIYCAAELALESEVAQNLTERIDTSGVAFMAEFPRRFAPATLRLKELIATQLGRPRIIFCHRRLPAEPPRRRGPTPSQQANRELVELIDWCRYVVGSDPTSVLSLLHGSEPNPDYRLLSVEFQGPRCVPEGVTCQISCGRYIPSSWHEAIGFRPPSGLQVCCERGLAFVDLPSSLVWFDEAGRHVESLDSERPVGEQLLTQFHRAVTSLVRKMGDLHDACTALDVLRASRESASEGRRISLAPPLSR
jgi:predicted dehydrogenase